MNRELFSDAMNEIDSKYVEEALTYKPAKRFPSGSYSRYGLSGALRHA